MLPNKHYMTAGKWCRSNLKTLGGGVSEFDPVDWTKVYSVTKVRHHIRISNRLKLDLDCSVLNLTP